MTLVDFVAALTAHVLGASSVTDLIAQRFTPIPIPEGQPKPRASYAIAGCMTPTTLDGGDEDGLLEVRYQIDAWAASFAEALAIAEAIRIRMQSASFKTIPEPDEDNGRHLYEHETKLHRFHWRYISHFST